MIDTAVSAVHPGNYPHGVVIVNGVVWLDGETSAEIVSGDRVVATGKSIFELSSTATQQRLNSSQTVAV